MVQNSSNKVLSLHLENCVVNCPHNSICYHKKKHKYNNNSSILTRYDELLKIADITYEFTCKNITESSLNILREYKNYNLTTSVKNVLIEDLNKLSKTEKKRIYISVYNMKEINEFKEYNKLFLIKDFKTLLYFYTILNIESIRKIHFLIDQTFLLHNPYDIRDIIISYNKRKNKDITLDSCLTGILFNNKCPYTQENCVDITYDNSLRRCPFTQYSKHIIPKDINLNTLWEIDLPECDCAFKKLLGD